MKVATLEESQRECDTQMHERDTRMRDRDTQIVTLTEEKHNYEADVTKLTNERAVMLQYITEESSKVLRRLLLYCCFTTTLLLLDYC